MAKQKLIHGTKTPRVNYRQVALGDIVGKTVQGVARTTVEPAEPDLKESRSDELRRTSSSPSGSRPSRKSRSP